MRDINTIIMIIDNITTNGILLRGVLIQVGDINISYL